MALIECHECKTEISSEAAACPKCGAPNRQKSAVAPLDSSDLRASNRRVGIVVFWIVVSISGLVIAGMIGDSLDSRPRPTRNVEGERLQSDPRVASRAILDYQKRIKAECLSRGSPAPPVGMTAERFCDAYGTIQAMAFCKEQGLQHTGFCS